jgi:hypothetical protein
MKEGAALRERLEREMSEGGPIVLLGFYFVFQIVVKK